MPITVNEIMREFQCPAGIAARVNACLNLDLEEIIVSLDITSAGRDILRYWNPRERWDYWSTSQRASAALHAADALLYDYGSYGVGPIRYEDYIPAECLNTGDSYSITILYDIAEDDFFLTTFGDYIEDIERKIVRALNEWRGSSRDLSDLKNLIEDTPSGLLAAVLFNCESEECWSNLEKFTGVNCYPIRDDTVITHKHGEVLVARYGCIGELEIWDAEGLREAQSE